MKKLITLAALLNLLTLSLYGHAVWIKTNGNGTVGEIQEIKIYYGEYATKEFEEVGKWYSDVGTFMLWLVSPDGSKKEIDYTASDRHYVASFTPAVQGVYVLTVTHSAKELDGDLMYQFNASALVAIGATGASFPNGLQNNDLYLVPHKSLDENFGSVEAFFKGKPASKITITVVGPSGWTKSFVTDDNGITSFELLWKGPYALEGTVTADEKGTHHDKPYQKIWRCATIRLVY